MKNKNKKIALFLGVLFLVFSFGSFLIPDVQAQAQGLVPCGSGSDPNNRCRLCHLIIGIKGIIDWGRTILVAVALTSITIGGVMYIVSAGNEEMMQIAKNIIKQALWGVVIVLGAWLIINTTMWLMATKDSGSDGGGLGISVLSWSEFSCDGDVGAYYDDNDADGEFDENWDSDADNPENDNPPVCGDTPGTCAEGTLGGHMNAGSIQIWDCVVGAQVITCS